jgi:DNA-binding NtrC family response regulator
MLRALERVLTLRATVHLCHDFADARSRLLAQAPDLLVTHTRLREYNGLHLVFLAAARDLSTRAVVYGEANDLGLAREVQAVGGFYVPRQRIVSTLPGYIGAALPPRDRRDLGHPDRRQQFRGGRRLIDSAAGVAT